MWRDIVLPKRSRRVVQQGTHDHRIGKFGQEGTSNAVSVARELQRANDANHRRIFNWREEHFPPTSVPSSQPPFLGSFAAS